MAIRKLKFRDLARFKSVAPIPERTQINIRRRHIDPRTKYIRKIKAEADIINDMLNALERAGYSDTWASKTLYNKLETPKINIIKGGKIDVSKISKDYSMSGLTYIRKALNDFIHSKTSTPEGVEARIEDERQFILEQTENQEFAESLTDDELSQIYSVFNDVDYKQLAESGQYDSLEIFSFIIEAKQEGKGIRAFMQTIRQYSEDYPDRDIRESFKNIYRKFVKSS